MKERRALFVSKVSSFNYSNTLPCLTMIMKLYIIFVVVVVISSRSSRKKMLTPAKKEKMFTQLILSQIGVPNWSPIMFRECPSPQSQNLGNSWKPPARRSQLFFWDQKAFLPTNFDQGTMPMSLPNSCCSNPFKVTVKSITSNWARFGISQRGRKREAI